MNSVNIWDAALYDEKMHFVSEFGKSVIALLDPKKEERILDLGCGTGDLTFEISKSGAWATGMDYSAEMIQTAAQKYPDLSFQTGNGETFRTDKKYDAVFSNAALHWMKQADKVVESVAQALKPDGRFVAEFGGKGNVAAVVQGITEALEERGVDGKSRNPWYFPSIGEYSTLLEAAGFHVTYACHFKRPTPLADGEKGLHHWLDSFADDFFPEFSSKEKAALYKKVQQKVQPLLFKKGVWVADYKRIRIAAVKQH